MKEALPTVDFVVDTNSIGLNLGIGQAMKKVRTRTDIQFEFDDPTVDSNG